MTKDTFVIFFYRSYQVLLTDVIIPRRAGSWEPLVYYNHVCMLVFDGKL
jgi:hypothetical protein